jgi:S-formylglutathione hydrolase FrmB
MVRCTCLYLTLTMCVATTSMASTIESGSVDTDMVPGPLEYNVLLPDGYASDREPYPLVLALAHGSGEKKLLLAHQPTFDRLWASGELPEMVVVMAEVRRHCGYVDSADGSEKWESVLVGPFLKHIRDKYHVTRDPKKTVVYGGSMGGAGAMQIAVRHPDKFVAAAARAAGLMPALKWKDVKRRNRAFLSDAHFKALYGDPVDEEYWEAFHPASIVARAPERIRQSGIKLYFACGDEDEVLLNEGNEFFHRVLVDHGIRHEYHLMHEFGHDAGGEKGLEEMLRFMGRALEPPPGRTWQPVYWQVIREKGGFPGVAGSPEENQRFQDEVVETVRKRMGGDDK